MFPLPSLELKTIEEDSFLGRYSIEPLHSGYGVMIGNSLRRVLLSSIPGAAPIAVRIEGVPHEFSVIEGVVEDVVQIILNLKKLVVAMDGDEIRTLTLDVSGERVVTAADIIPDAGLTIINPELHIAELSSSKSTLRMDILVSKGRGYVPTEKNKRPDYPIGTIWMDAMFTPVKNVKFTVEQTLIEQYLDFEKLTLDILCNGAVPPKEALDNALQILSEYYMAIGNPELLRKKETSLEETLEEKLALLIENVLPGLSPKVQHLLVYADIKTMRDLLMKTKTELVQHHNITHKAITELAKALEESQEYATFSQFNFPFLKEEGKAETEEEPKEGPVAKTGKAEKEPEIMEPEEAAEEEVVEEKVEPPVVEEPKPAKPSKAKAEKEQPKPEPVQVPKEEPKQDITKGFSIQDISLSKSTMTFLQQNKITDLALLLSMSKSQIEDMQGFKPKMIQEIEKNLDKVGLVLAQDQMFGNLSPQEREKAVWLMSIEDLVKEVPSITKAEMKSMNGAGIAAAGKLLELGKKGMKGSLKFSTKTIEDIEKRLAKWGLTLKE
ncbi:MAG TPA: DNA-directed RNA polymerase subunit alpha [Caldisericia bacterium]|nr:DNA-directed RNA polymerase subunit alpha [Caldisericia bacterium]